jgi:hypothetical protein
MPNERRITRLWQQCKSNIQNLNCFPSVPPSTDKHELRTQRTTTRLLIFLFILAMTILLLYTSLTKITKAVNVETPSLVEYSHLYSIYSQALTCPCSKIAINYDTFLEVEYTLHQVCTSTFVNQNWIDQFTKNENVWLYADDFRMTSPHTLQALQTFCDLINRAVFYGLIQFYSHQYVSASVISLELFQSEVKSLVEQFRLSMITSFLLSLSMIRDTTQANALLSALRTNYQLIVEANNPMVQTKALIYDGCRCNSSSACSIPSSNIIDPLSGESLFNVPGFRTGCYLVESLLQSTLECFFSQDCINKLQSYMTISLSMRAIALNASISSRYSINSTIGELVDNLMIERWYSLRKYDSYYNECQPTGCSYTFET